MLLAMLKVAAIALLAAFSITLLLTAPAPAEGGSKPQVAIIGGGIGGAATAYFVRQLCGDHVSIHVFEREHVGGRLMSLGYDGGTYELGGSMVRRLCGRTACICAGFAAWHAPACLHSAPCICC